MKRDGKRSSVISNFFPFVHLRHASNLLGVIKNSACDCPSQLLYFVYFFSLSSLSHLDSELFFFLFKSRSYQLFSPILLLSERDSKNMIMTLHCSLKSIKQPRFERDRAERYDKESCEIHEIKNKSFHSPLPRYRVKHQNIFKGFLFVVLLVVDVGWPCGKKLWKILIIFTWNSLKNFFQVFLIASPAQFQPVICVIPTTKRN